MTKYFVDTTGAYLGGYDGAEPPVGAVEVPTPPARALQTWDGNAWTALTSAQVRDSMPQITARQLRLALLSVGIHEADIDTRLSGDPAGMIEWQYASYYKRSHPLINQLGPLFSITPEQIDSLWLWAGDL